MPRTQKGRNDQLIRLLSILRDLDRRDGCTLYELADRYGTTLRTIRRDLDALQAAELPLVELQSEFEGERRKRWRIEYPDPRRQLGRLLDASHYLGVVAALGTGAAATQTNATRVALSDLATKLSNVLSVDDRKRLGAVAKTLQVANSQALQTQPADVLWPLAVALTESCLCEVQYSAVAGKRSRLTILPLRLFSAQGLLYLLTYDPLRDVIRTLALHRIDTLRVTKVRGSCPAAIDPDRFVESLFGAGGVNGTLVTYKLRFAAEVAPYIRERIWHPSQKLRARKDGGVDLAFTCQESVEVTAWVASWRHHVEALSPPELRTELCALGVSLQSKYA